MADSWESGRILYCYGLQSGGKCTIMSNLNNISSSLLSCSLKVYKFAISDTTSTHFLTFPAFNGMQHTCHISYFTLLGSATSGETNVRQSRWAAAILKVEKMVALSLVSCSSGREATCSGIEGRRWRRFLGRVDLRAFD